MQIIKIRKSNTKRCSGASQQYLWARYGHLYTPGITPYSESNLIKMYESAPTVSLHLLVCKLNLAIVLREKTESCLWEPRRAP